jgi:hypothetical protein
MIHVAARRCGGRGRLQSVLVMRRLFNVLAMALLLLCVALTGIAIRSASATDAFLYQRFGPRPWVWSTSGFCWSRGRIGVGYSLEVWPPDELANRVAGWTHATDSPYFGTYGDWSFWWSREYRVHPHGQGKGALLISRSDFAARIWPIAGLFATLPIAWVVARRGEQPTQGFPVIQGTSTEISDGHDLPATPERDPKCAAAAKATA